MFEERFDDRSRDVFNYAVRKARATSQNFVSVEHVLVALAALEGEMFCAVASQLDLPPGRVVSSVEARVRDGPRYMGAGVRIAPEVNDLLRRALARARANRRSVISVTALLLCLAQDERGVLAELLAKFGCEFDKVIATVRAIVQKHEKQDAPKGHSAAHSSFAVGDIVRIKAGAFISLTGKVKEVYEDRSTLRVDLPLQRPLNSVEVNYRDVEKLSQLRR